MQQGILTKPPSNLLHTLADTVGVDDHSNVQEQEVRAGTLGTCSVLETLDRVQGLKGRETPGEADTKEVNGDDDTVGEVGRVLALGRECGEQNVEEQRSAKRVQHHGPTSELVEHGRTNNGSDHGEDGVDGVDEQLRVCVCDTGGLDHLRHEVADDVVSRPLSEEGHHDDHVRPVAGRLGVEQLAVVPPGVLVSVHVALLDDLAILQLHKRVVGIAVAVVLGHDPQSFFGAVLGDEPTGRFREEEDEHHGDGGHGGLDDGRGPPSPGARQVQVGAVCSPTGTDFLVSKSLGGLSVLCGGPYRMLPSHHRLLYMPAWKPLKLGCASSTV